MKENTFKNITSLFFIFSHFSFILYVIYVYFIERSLQKEYFTATLTVVFPTFASFTTAIITFLVQNKFKLSFGEKRVNIIFAIVTIFISVVYVVLLFSLFISQWKNPVYVDEYTSILAVVETLVAVYIAMIIKSIFEEKNK